MTEYRPPSALYPFDSRWLDRGSHRVHYLDEGTDSGVPLLFLHGNPTWSFLYRGALRSLRSSRRCIAPDFPGFGLSDLPPSGAPGPRAHSQAIEQLIEELDLDRFVLVLHDWGGPVGLHLALERPRCLRGLVLMNTWCWTPDWYLSLFSRCWGSTLGRYLCRRHNAFVRWMLPLGLYHGERFTDSIREAYRQPLHSPERRQGTWVLPRSIRSEADWLESIRDRLGTLPSVPIRLLWGMADPAFGWETYLDRWSELFPRASITRLPDASHYVPEDRPDALVEAIESLEV